MLFAGPPNVVGPIGSSISHAIKPLRCAHTRATRAINPAYRM